MYYLKLSLVLLVSLIICSCISKDSGELLLKSSTEPAENKAVINDVDTLQNTGNESEDDILTVPAKFNFRSPYQTKSRRTKIKFPDDCTDTTGAGKKFKYLPAACAYALRSARSALQKAADEGKCNSQITDDQNNQSYPVIDGDKILSYKIKNSAETDISILTKKLGTIFENIAKNNELDYPLEFKIGQELKFQKAHYIYNFNPTFYSLSPNRYLVEIGCWTAAYNLANIYLLYDESAIPAKAKVLEFPYLKLNYGDIYDDYDEKNDVPASVVKIKIKTLGGRWFDRKTKKLIVFVKAHGIGDAGRYARYSFVNGKPKLEEFRARIIWSGRDYQVPDVIKSPPKTWKRYYP